jgi:hypothetical protein
VIANYATDRLLTPRRIGGAGAEVSALEWDVKLYFTLNGATHDAAITAWDNKRAYDYARPISMIRYIGGLGQSSQPGGSAYDPCGLPLEAGLIEIVTSASTAPGGRHEHLAGSEGKIAIRAWPGEPSDPLTQHSGAQWVLAENWRPYQKKTFVTPPFAAFTSGHSTFSRAAAEVLTAYTGDSYFPGGLATYSFARNAYLSFEQGPSEDLTLQWARYYDAADEAGVSRLWGGIHVRADDFQGRIAGSRIGKDAYALALTYFDGSIAR